MPTALAYATGTVIQRDRIGRSRPGTGDVLSATLESAVPTCMTVAEWRRLGVSRRPPKRRHLPIAVSHGDTVVQLRPAIVPREAACEHFHETITRYDYESRHLTSLVICRTCGLEKVVATQYYEPHYEPTPQIQRRAA